MTAEHHGTPCWYELVTSDLNGAEGFYTDVLDWGVVDSGLPGFDYRLAKVDEAMVAGLMGQPEPGMPTFWMIYFSVENADRTADAAAAAGGKVFRAPADIPNTGRFAILVDPQGAAFGILEPLPGGQGNAFAPGKAGHGCWNELMTADPKGARDFYGTLFGWTEARQFDMGPAGIYHLIGHRDGEIGGMFSLMPGVTQSHWRPYFGVDSAARAVARIVAAGGTVQRGPDEVPGGAFVVQATDAQGVRFWVTGPA